MSAFESANRTYFVVAQSAPDREETLTRSAMSSSGQFSEVATLRRDVCFIPESGHWTDIPGGPFCASNGSRAHIVASRAWLRRSFGQPGSPQSFLVLFDVFGLPIGAQHIFEIGNAQFGVQLPQPGHGLMCLLRSSGHCIACCGDA